METWNQRLAQALAESEFTPNALAKKLRVSAPTVSAWIGAGSIKPARDIRANHLFDVCALLNVRPEWVLYRRNPKRIESKDASGIPQKSEVYPDVAATDDDVKNWHTPTAKELKQEITAALGSEGVSNELLMAVCLMLRAGQRAPVRGDQHHTKTVKREHGHAGRRKAGGTSG